MKKKRIKQLNKKYERCLYGPDKRRGWILKVDNIESCIFIITMKGVITSYSTTQVEIDPDPDGDRTDREDG